MFRKKLIVFLIFLFVSSMLVSPVVGANIRGIDTEDLESSGITRIDIHVNSVRDVRVSNIPKDWEILSFKRRGVFNNNISTTKENKTVGWKFSALRTERLHIEINASQIKRKTYTFNVTAIGTNKVHQKTTLNILSPYKLYDINENREIERNEAGNAIIDYIIKHKINRELLEDILKKYQNN